MPGVDSPWAKKRRQELATLYKRLTEKPADEIRKIAQAEIDTFAAALGGARDRLGGVVGRWKFFDEALADARQFVSEGDALTAATDEPSRITRRRRYARAYTLLLSATDELDPEIAAGATWVVALQDLTEKAEDTAKKAADKVEQAAEKMAEKAADTLEKVGEGFEELGTILAVGAGLALVTYAALKGRR